MRSILRSTTARNALLLGAMGAGAAFWGQVGCSSPGASEPGSTPPGTTANPPADNTGSVGMQLTLPGGEQVNSINWTVTGPSGASTVVQSGTVLVGSSSSISFLVGGIPAGSNYTISLSGSSTDMTATCAGTASFSTTARTTTNVSVVLQCNSTAPEAGSALITGTTFNCGTVTSISASPAEVIVGNPIALNSLATGPNPGALTYAWSAPSGSGSFSNATAANPTFTCSAPAAPLTLTLTVADGAVPPGAACRSNTSSIQVTCDGHLDAAQQYATATKIKHLVVIFGENVSFDHYFGTYPTAQNNPGDTAFTAAPGTPVPNGLVSPLDPTHGFTALGGPSLLTANPNASATGNGAGASNPFRLAAEFAETSSQGHNYMPEQQADDNGRMDLFPDFTGHKGPPPPADAGAPATTQTTGLVMAYYDGNTLNAWWSYAQQYALNDNMWTTDFGPSSPGAVNLISGQTNGLVPANGTPSSSAAVADGNGGLTMIGDSDPTGDTCSTTTGVTAVMTGPNIGTLLSAQAITWGWFEGGFNLGITNPNGKTGCARSTPQTVPFSTTSADYVPHHEPFQYYASTANPTHARPTGTIGTTDAANHQYDTLDFTAALAAGTLPAVVYVKAPSFQDGHPGNSNPVDEQNFVTSIVSALQGTQEWSSTAIVLTYDDSDGWYDHQEPPIVNPSATASDALNGPSLCNSGAQQNGAAPTTPLLGVPPADGGAPAPAQGRCGYGTRVPLMVISPFARKNYVDHTLVDQTSVLKFIEDNWLSGQRIQPGGSFDTIAGSIQNMLTGD
jgi:phospholipase C